MKTKAFYLTFLLALMTAGSVLSQEHEYSNARKCNDCFPEGGGGGGGGGGGATTFSACSALSNGAVLYVDQSKATSGNGTSWAQAVKSLSEAIQYANDCDKVSEIRVARGTYKPSTTASTASRKHTFFIERGYKLTGGYPSGGGSYNPAENPTILDGDLGSGFQSYHVLVVAGTNLLNPVTVDGFRVRNGASDGAGFLDLGDELGYVYEHGGGAAYLLSASRVTFRNCAFYDNGNANSTKGGAFYCNGSSVTLLNCVVEGNQSLYGGGIMMDNNPGTFHAINSTFYGNTGEFGETFYNHLATSMKLTNCIVWGDSPVWGGNGTRLAEYSIIRGYSELAPGAPVGPGNHYLNPQFRNPDDPNGADNQWFTNDDGLSLRSCSPAINMGSNTAVSGLSLSKDITGADRIYNVTIDAGAYEYHSIPQPGSATSLAGNDSDAFGSFAFVYGGTTVIHSSCEIIASVTPDGASPVSGKTWAYVYYGRVGPGLPSLGSTVYAPRFYKIDPLVNGNTATARITLYFKQSDFDAYNTAVGPKNLHLPANSTDTPGKSNLLITQFHGQSEDYWAQPGTYDGPTEVFHPKNEDIVWHPGKSANPLEPPQGYWSVSFPVTGFSGFFVSAGTNNPLPVNLVSLSAKPENSAVQLSWTTTSESNSSHFLVQRSADAREFTEIGRVEAAGNSGNSHSYSFTDDAPFAQASSPLLYYRLKPVDRDGTYTFSRIVSVKMPDGPDTEPIVLLGNPVSDGLRLRYRATGEEKVRIRLRDVSGRLLGSLNRQLGPGEHELSLSMQKLPAGLYLAEVVTDGERKVFRIVKE